MTGGGTDLTLSPGFESDKYLLLRRSVASTVAEVTVDADAERLYRRVDGNIWTRTDMRLFDVNTGVTGQQVAVAVGDTVIKVKVTAEDGNHDPDLHGDGEPGGRRRPAPTITEVAVTSIPKLTSSGGGSTPDTYGAGETIEVSVTFDEPVTATAGTDFELSVGAAKGAPLLRGSGTATLVFGYTVQAADTDDDGILIGTQDQTLVGTRNANPQTGTIASVATGEAANLTHSALGVQSGHKVDGTRSIVRIAVSSTPLLTLGTPTAPARRSGSG